MKEAKNDRHNMKSTAVQRLLALMLAMLTFAACAAFPAAANAGIREWSGTTGTGALLTDGGCPGNCPVEVRHETLVLTLAEFPPQTDSTEYTGRVTADYELYNPIDADVTVSLAFPFGLEPEYGYAYNAQDGYYFPDDTARYDVTSDGQPVDRTVRHTLFVGSRAFDLDRDLPLLRDDYAPDAFFSPEMPVTTYTCRLETVPDGLPSNACLSVFFTEQSGTVVLVSPRQGVIELGGGRWRKDRYVQADETGSMTVTLYAIGRPLDTLPDCRLHQDANAGTPVETDTPVTVTAGETITLMQLIRQENERNAESADVSDVDLYNAAVDRLRTGMTKNGCIAETDLNLSGCLLRWYAYTLMIPAHGTVRHTVTAPLYPSIDGTMQPEVYTYAYLLSPASTWADFGTLDIEIITPFHLLRSSLGDFEKTDTGYRLSMKGLPSSELEFDLCESEKPKKERTAWNTLLPILLIIGVLLLIVASIGVLIILILIIRAIVRRCRRKNE